MATVFVGTSGWVYPGWRTRFYPPTLKQREVLSFMSRQFNSLEVNGTFYCLQRPDTFARWYEESPPGFLFAVKGSRFISHNKKLLDAHKPLANFFASGLLRLEEKLGPIVWQLPATAKLQLPRLSDFLELLPRDTEAAAALAAQHDHRVEGRSWTTTKRKRRIRYALEVRNPTFYVPEFVRLLRRHDVALVVSDAAGWEMVEEVTASFVYVRLHGTTHTYASAYDEAAATYWAERVRRWHRGSEPEDARRVSSWQVPRRKQRDVFVFFDNDYEANAPWDAKRLMRELAGGEKGSPSP